MRKIKSSYNYGRTGKHGIIRDGNIYRNFKSGDWWLSHFNDSNKGGF